MKNLFYVGILVVFVAFGFTTYRQYEKANIYREEKNKMHLELIRMRNELASSKLQVAKLKQIIEAEKKNTQELMQMAQKRK